MAALYQLEIVTPMGRTFEGLVDNLSLIPILSPLYR